MATLADWLRDWRRVAEAVPEGRYDGIEVANGASTFEILRISSFDLAIDGDRRAIRTGARVFDTKTALYTHLTRDTGVVRFITMRGRPRYVLEPGSDCLEWAADTEGVSERELVLAHREGALGRKVAKLVRRGQREGMQLASANIAALRQRAEDAEEEAALLRAELAVRERELARLQEV